MNPSKNYHLGLLYLTHLLILADGEVDEKEFVSLLSIKEKEKIPDSMFKEFVESVREKKEKEIYKIGIELISKCSQEEKLDVFAHLFTMAQVDGSFHVREVRFLLYSIKSTDIEFNEVITHAKKFGSINL